MCVSKVRGGLRVTRTTISDVAKAAGVSMKSVSRVINSEPNVSEKLRNKVQVAIDALGYVPDLAARSLAGARAFAIGVLFDNPSPNYTMKIQTGAYKACREQDFHLIVDHIDSAAGDVAGQMEAILRHVRIDGFILTPPLSEDDAVMAVLERRAIPFVRIAPWGYPGRGPGVAIDDARAASELAGHLWNLGHRRFGIVNGPTAHSAARARRQGFVDWLAAHGCTQIAESYGGFDFETGIAAGQELMRLAQAPTAIFAANDDSAAGVMAGLAQLGYKVPDDVSVVGFDDSWIARTVWPSLTTIYQPISEMAYAATMILIDRNRPEDAPGDTMLDYALVVRNSAAAPRT